MRIPFFQVDAFTDKALKGNPAAVCVLEGWPEDGILQGIAAENNLSETAFVVPGKERWHLRWFTPTLEVDLCGHATLATAHILLGMLNKNEIQFDTLSGILSISKNENFITMDLPAWKAEPADLKDAVREITGIMPEATYKTRDLMAVYESEQIIRDIEPDLKKLRNLEFLGMIITARGKEFDFVSRFFAPKAGVDEDPVTGSAHSTLAPYWSHTLELNRMTACQLSDRGGELICELDGDRVRISGKAVTVIEGEMLL